MPTKACYKVVLKQGDKFYSPFAIDKVEYAQDRWTEAPYGGLFVYGSLVQAVNEVRFPSARNLALFTCECDGPMPLPKRCRDFREAWKELGTPQDWPPTTLVFKRVKLLELIMESGKRRVISLRRVKGCSK